MPQQLTTTSPGGWPGRIKGRVLCWLGNHEPLRTKVRRKGLYFHGNCQRCGCAIRKLNGQPWQKCD